MTCSTSRNFIWGSTVNEMHYMASKEHSYVVSKHANCHGTARWQNK